MSLPLRYRPEARADLDSIYEKYWLQSPRAAERFIARFEQLMQTVRDSPFLFAKVFRYVRAATIRKFPYVVYYRVKRDRIEILAICHDREEDRIKKLRR